MAVPGREARHRERVDVAARAAEPVHRLRGDDQRVGGVETAADADDDLGLADRVAAAARARRPGCCRPRSSRGPAAPGRRARTGTGRPCGAARCRRTAGSSSKSTVRNSGDPSTGAAVVVERALPQPLLADPVEVDVGDGPPRAVGEPLALGEQVAALVDHRLPVPRQVGRRLALAGGGEDVRRAAARAGAAHQQPAVLGAGDGDRAAGQVGEHGRAGERGLGARRHRHPHVLADLDVQREARHVGGAEDQVGPERHARHRERDRAAAPVVAGREPAPLVELAVGRQVGLRRDTQHPPAVDHDRAVEHPGAVHQRRSDDQHRPQVGAGLTTRRSPRARASSSVSWRNRSSMA